MARREEPGKTIKVELPEEVTGKWIFTQLVNIGMSLYPGGSAQVNALRAAYEILRNPDPFGDNKTVDQKIELLRAYLTVHDIMAVLSRFHDTEIQMIIAECMKIINDRNREALEA